MFLMCLREHARKLALENEALHDQVRQTEKDTVDVVGFLKGQDEQKDEQVRKFCTAIRILARFDGIEIFLFFFACECHIDFQSLVSDGVSWVMGFAPSL